MAIDTLSVATQGFRSRQACNLTLCIATLGLVCVYEAEEKKEEEEPRIEVPLRVGGGGGGVGFVTPPWWRVPGRDEVPLEDDWQAPVFAIAGEIARRIKTIDQDREAAFEIAGEIARRIKTIDQDREAAFEKMLVIISVSIGVAVDGGELEKRIAASLEALAKAESKKLR